MNVFDLFATIQLDTKSYENSLDDTKKTAISKIGGGMKTAAKVGMAAVSAVGVAIGGVVKKSVDSFSQYEQLVGGVDTLFKKASERVQKNAEKAFQTAGMSANTYMETVTSFSASLIQSLGGDTRKAADMADMAIVDMSDNANKMGSSIESIQNAYQGFAKQNYTMLDNLKLGYGGTQQEMYRLMSDAAKVDKKFAETAQFSIDSKNHLTAGYADIVRAIHIIQDQMGIAGTTTLEGATTIEGSFKSMKAAWDNLITGFGNKDADLSKLINDVISNAAGAFSNIIPVIEQALNGIGTFIDQIAPKIGEGLPKAINKIVPKLLKSGANLITSLVRGISKAMPELARSAIDVINYLVESFIEVFPEVQQAGYDLFVELGEGVANTLPTLIPKVTDLLTKLIENMLNNIPRFIQTGLDLLLGLADGILKAIPKIVKAIPKLIKALVNAILKSIPQIINAGVKLLTSLVDNLPEIIDSIVSAIPEIITGIVNAFVEHIGDIVDAGVELLTALIEDLPKIISTIIEAVPKIIQGIFDAFTGKGALKRIFDAGINIAIKLFKGILGIIPRIPELLWKLVKKIINYFIKGKWLEDIVEAGKGIINALWDGLKAAWQAVKDWFSEIGDWIVENFGDIIRGITEFIGSLIPTIGESIKYTGNLAADTYDEALKNKHEIDRMRRPEVVTTSNGYAYSKPSKLVARMSNVTDVQTSATIVAQNKQVTDKLDELIDITKQDRDKDTTIQLDNREVGRMVRKYA